MNIKLKPYPMNVCGGSYHLLNLKITPNCNGKCKFCIASGAKSTVETNYKKIIKTAIAMKNFQKVDVLGGEPTLSPHFQEIIRAIRPYKQEIGIITNGCNLDVLMNNLDYIDTITISIHHYDMTKNATKINIDIDKLKKLNKKKNHTKTICACLISKDTIYKKKDLFTFIRRMKKLGFDEIKFMELITMNDKLDLYVDLQDLFKEYGIHQKNPTLCGCYTEVPGLTKKFGIKVTTKLTCPYSNIYKAKTIGIPTIEYQKDYMNVVQPDGTVTEKWEYESFKNKIINGEDFNVNYEN